MCSTRDCVSMKVFKEMSFMSIEKVTSNTDSVLLIAINISNTVFTM